MKPFPSLVLLSLATAQLVPLPWQSSAAQAAPSPDGLKWTYSLTEARRQSKRTGKLIFIDFSTTWCAYCKILDQRTYNTDAFRRESQKWILVRIDGDKSPQIAAKYEVTGFPTMVFADANGNSIGQLSGYVDVKTLTSQMREATGEKNPRKK